MWTLFSCSFRSRSDSMLLGRQQNSCGINTCSYIDRITKDNMVNVRSCIFLSPTTLISRREEIDLQLKISSYCTGSKVHCLFLSHRCKTDTCFHAWLYGGGGICVRPMKESTWPPSQLSSLHVKNGNAASFRKVLSISRLCYWYMPWINRPGFPTSV